MQYELNIGLNVKGKSNSKGDVDRRAHDAITVLRMAMVDLVQTERYSSTFDGPDGTATEYGLFAKLNYYGAQRTLFDMIAARIAKELEQDCVAVFIPSLNQGKLCGPRADQWGQFNPEYFVRFDPVGQQEVTA